MPIEFKCHCGQRLKVADTNAGKRAKCPKCQAELRVPDATPAETPFAPAAASPGFAAAAAPAAAAPAGGGWTVQTAEGEQYGPISRTELDQWLAEGRLDENCQLLREGWDQWKWANEVYPSIGGAGGGGSPAIKSDNPFDFSSGSSGGNRGGGGGGGYSSGGGYTYVKPHRGTMVLVMGILSIVFCPFLGIFAWMMGAADLREMKSGRMDKSGEGHTQAGYICGIIGTVLFAIQVVFILLYIVLIVGVVAAGGR